jgi:hypothetical protein
MGDLIIKPESGGSIKIQNSAGTDALVSDNSANLALGTVTSGSFGGTGVTGTGGVRSRQIFTATGTWTKPSGITTIKVQVQGSGGGGGTWQSAGGAGGYGEKLIDVTSISSETVTVGEPGAGGANASQVGGTVSFGSHVTATGGQARAIQGNDPGRGGNCSGGDINMKGGGGTNSHNDNSTMVSAGGASFFGGGPPGRYNDVPQDGNTDGGAYGTGGASAEGSGHGGDGVKGVVIVEEYS